MCFYSSLNIQSSSVFSWRLFQSQDPLFDKPNVDIVKKITWKSSCQVSDVNAQAGYQKKIFIVYVFLNNRYLRFEHFTGNISTFQQCISSWQVALIKCKPTWLKSEGDGDGITLWCAAAKRATFVPEHMKVMKVSVKTIDLDGVLVTIRSFYSHSGDQYCVFFQPFIGDNRVFLGRQHGSFQ